MLDPETRKRIDNARDILVGKVPDPKSQVEQITIALIYKFMDDMDKEAEELGGKATFFKGEFAKYSWSNIFDPKLGGYELINLYGEAITRMNQNKNIPQLFRDIFKNAFLPYRDPETLKSFLKEINDFHYDHSERLGDAFEYLLSVLGVQGDAGSLRTPRHIIDFIVKVIAPKKTETILDPACGTAGFLISAYKHIRDQNTDKRKGNQLTPDDRKRLMNSIVGHDISPDMVRLSLVNMYLHGFQNPKIYEYDTLTSDDRWNETYDIILANPPFMTPKGGIRPHKRFSIPANRSEVLFVDYIMEHIATDGRAGVIVPEGIIFQSANAYKALRKALVENGYLYAVVSLPAGVFNPYSGVKTSILLMDRTLAKKAKDILFVKIENDGFDLGAQRREVDRSDLPEALRIIQTYQECIRKGKEFNVGAQFIAPSGKTTAGKQGGMKQGVMNHAPTGKQTTTDKHTGSPLQELFHIIPKTKIAESGDYNLTGDRYRERIVHAHKDWPMVELGSVVEIYNGSTPLRSNNEYWENGTVPWFTIEDVRRQGRLIKDTSQKITDKALNETSVKLLPEKTVLLCCTASVGEYAIANIKLATNQQFNGLVVKESLINNLLPEFLFWISSYLKNELIILSGKTSFNFVSVGTLKQLKIPLPPLSVQKEIVAEIEGYQKIIDGARQVIANYRPQIKIDPEWPIVKLGVVASIGGTITKSLSGNLPYIGADSLESHTGHLLEIKTVKEQGISGPLYEFAGKRILYSKIRPYLNKLSLIDFHGYCSSDMYPLSVDKQHAIDEFVAYYLLSNSFNNTIREFYERASIPKINRDQLFSTLIPLPPLKIQKQIVAQIEEEQKLVEANRKLIEIFEGKIKAKIAEVWGEEAPSEAEPELLMVAEEKAKYGGK